MIEWDPDEQRYSFTEMTDVLEIMSFARYKNSVALATLAVLLQEIGLYLEPVEMHFSSSINDLKIEAISPRDDRVLLSLNRNGVLISFRGNSIFLDNRESLIALERDVEYVLDQLAGTYDEI